MSLFSANPTRGGINRSVLIDSHGRVVLQPWKGSGNGHRYRCFESEAKAALRLCTCRKSVQESSPQPNSDTTHRFAECSSFVIRIHHFCGYPCQLLDDFLLTSDSPDSTLNTNLAALALLPLFVSKFIWGPADHPLRYIIPLNPPHLPFLSFSLRELYRSLRH